MLPLKRRNLNQAFRSSRKYNLRSHQQEDTNTNTNTKMQLLSKKALSALNIANAAFSYERADVQPGILHFSTGNFHRAHQGSYYHDLFNSKDATKEDLKWGIRECSTRGGGSYTDETRPDLKDQDFLYTLVEMDAEKSNARVIGSIVGMLPYQDDHQPIKDALLDTDATKIVSMTVTEGGYFLDPSTGQFDPENDDIQHDANNPEDPQTVFGLIVQALKKRRDKGQPPFTVMSCDNVPQNGIAAKNATVGLAKLMDNDLGEWIDENVAFPCSMVDRITPAPTDDLAKDAGANDWEYRDDAPIFCEPFRQWVCEDKFCNNQRPSLDKVGVKFVNDVTPYEEMKLRILNGGHASLCYPAALLGIEYVHEAMENKKICQFLDKLQKDEIVPGVPPVPDTDLEEYWETVRGRYQNPKLSDRIDRNCENGSDRQPKFILPSIKSCLDTDKDNERSLKGLATVSAMWCRFCQGKSESGDEIEIVDGMADKLKETAEAAKDEPKKWLTSLEEVYGELGENEKFQKAFEDALNTIQKDGVEAALQKYIES